MTANGLALYYVLSLLALLAGRAELIPWGGLLLCCALAIGPGASSLKLFSRATLVALPLVIWLALIWVGVGPPEQVSLLIYQTVPGSSPWWLVSALGMRFFALALLTFAAVEKGSRIYPSFALRLSLPREAKVVLLATSSFGRAFVEGVRRAHTALVAANIITARRSLTNFRNGWLLVRTSWIAAIGVAAERLDTKWQLENLPDSVPFDSLARPAFSKRDLYWLAPAMVVCLLQALRMLPGCC